MLMADLRKEYCRAELHRRDLDSNPIRQFEKWFRAAVDAQVLEPSVMALATAGADGCPSVRMVLLKGIEERGFLFFTHYAGRKGRELAENPHAGLAMYWPALERQIRATGTVSQLTRRESEAYFNSRPKESRLAAWASRQSQVLASRQDLEDEFARMRQRYSGEDVPLPPDWGGYLLTPIEMEFWQGRSNRLHDRFRYRRSSDQGWAIERLAP
jgi:pyridoxamine 5'-phosphate oxidase